MSSSAGGWRIGNDLVDLREPGALEQHRNARFVARVFTDAERAAIQGAASPARTLWAIWAAKEAVFKIARKADARAIFAHARFEVDARALARFSTLPAPGAAPAPGPGHRVAGRVRAPGFEARARWGLGVDRIHCVAWAPAEPGARPASFRTAAAGAPRLVSRAVRLGAWERGRSSQGAVLNADEARSTYSAEGRLLRVFAREVLARELGDERKLESRLTIQRAELGDRRFGPPLAYLDGAPVTGVDLSLSHDGEWLALAALIERATTGTAFPVAECRRLK